MQDIQQRVLHQKPQHLKKINNVQNTSSNVIYYLNPDSKKVHYSTCRTIKVPSNYSKTNNLSSALSNGYVKCKVCFH